VLKSRRNPLPWQIFEARAYIPDTSSDEAREWAESKRSSCCSSHDTCNLARSNGSLPTRLLDVGNPRASFVKVQVTTPATTGEYLAPSHCWGDPSDVATVLTNETFNEYITTGLAFELLPKTFQDAVLFTRSLGKRYLWIDSLCIIQNNADDWDREAATMCSVYQGALLTIAAASSSSGRGGLLYEPPTHRITRTTPNGPYTLFGRESIRHKEKEYPLLTRGWLFRSVFSHPELFTLAAKSCYGSAEAQGPANVVRASPLTSAATSPRCIRQQQQGLRVSMVGA